ncbi:PilN domain-containing protein [Luteimonas notoginsengisoli]|jgi:general secretion pathway protein L|uniref:PilN domain-containing protein n=1 Tax=Luteimonas notoginsengisoli TaxID=1578200 RepID=A0ABV7UPG6_9GAMM
MTAAVDNQSATPSLRQRLGRAGGRLRPGIGGFWRWWTQALASWLSPRLRTLFGLDHERVLLQLAGSELRLALERGDGVQDIAQLPWSAQEAARGDDLLASLLVPRVADMPRWLLLPASAGLRRRLAFPAAAAERLRDVVAFEIDRQTPFAAADVHFDARVVARSGDQIEAELVAVPRATLDAALASLGALGGTVAGVDMAGDDGAPLGINLLADARRHRRADPWRAWNWAFAALAVFALALAMWQLLANRRAAADAFADTANARARQARQVAVEKRQLVDLVEGMAFLQSTRAARPTTVEVLDELGRRLPDSTYLEKLSIEGDQILLIGQSSEASALVGQLESSKLWRSPALTGALQPDPRTHRDRFTMTAQLAIAATPGNGGKADARSQP